MKMAEHFADPLQFLTEKLLCPKCEGVFKNLKQLPCLHSVCRSCLETLLQTRDQDVIVACPCCQQECRLESGNVDDLPESLYIASLHDVAHIMSSKLTLMTCAFCNNSPSTLQGNYCFQCKKFWCENCLNQHSRHSAIHVNHDRLVALKDIPDDQSPLKPCTYCKKEHHERKEVKLFCTNCDIAICSLCSQTDHENHKKKTLKGTASQCKSQMETLIDEQLKEAQKKMDEIVQVDKECDEVNSQETEVAKDVINFFDAITKCLEAKKKEILDAVSDEAMKSRSLLKRHKKLIQNQGEVIRFAMEATEALLMHSTSVEIIDLKKSWDKIVNEVNQEERVHCDPERKPLQMNFVRAQEALDILQTKGIGLLQMQSETSADQCSAEGNGIREAFVGLGATLTLSTRNTKGEPYYNKRDRITVEVKDKDGEDSVMGVRIQDNHDGTYQIRYFTKEAGESEASVKVK